jgi:hypothetical protein
VSQVTLRECISDLIEVEKDKLQLKLCVNNKTAVKITLKFNSMHGVIGRLVGKMQRERDPDVSIKL